MTLEADARSLRPSRVPFIIVNGAFVVPGLVVFLLMGGLPAIQTALEHPVSVKNYAWAALLNLAMIGTLG